MSESLTSHSNQLVESTAAVAAAYRHEGRWNDALQLLEAGLLVEEASEAGIAQLQIILSDLLIKRAHYDRARDLLNEAHLTAQEQQDDSLLSAVLYNQGEIHYFLRMLKRESSYDTALDLHMQAMRLCETLGYDSAVVDSMSRIGVLHERKREHGKAQAWYEKAIERAKSINYPLGTKRPLTHIATYHMREEDMLRALAEFRESLRVSEEAEEIDGIMFGLGNLGHVLYQINGGMEEALRYLHEALEIAERLEHKLAIWVMAMRIGDIHAEQNDYRTALESYQRTYDVASNNDLSVLAGPAEIKLKSARSKVRNAPPA